MQDAIVARTAEDFGTPLTTCMLCPGAGVSPVMALAQRAGLESLVRRHVTIAARTGAYTEVKVGCLVAGHGRGRRLDRRHGPCRGLRAMPEWSGGVGALSTLGLFLRSFTWGNVRQLEMVVGSCSGS